MYLSVLEGDIPAGGLYHLKAAPRVPLEICIIFTHGDRDKLIGGPFRACGYYISPHFNIVLYT